VRFWRPIDGWRRFADEIIVVVLGVLIALGAGAVADGWRWRGDVAAARLSLDAEVAQSAAYALDRMAIAPCLRERRAAIAERLRAPGRWRPIPVPGFQPPDTILPRAYGVPYRPWISSTWDALAPTGVLAHMDREDAATYGAIYHQIGIMRAAQEREAALAPQLTPVLLAADPGAAGRGQLLATLTQLDGIDTLMKAVAEQMFPLLNDVGALRDPELREVANAFVPLQRQLRGACVRRLEVRAVP
jgi:hypothetical protein